MKLSKYMEMTGKKDAALAVEIGRERSTVTKLRLGTARPSFEVMLKLERITEGLVKPSDFGEAA